MIYKCNLEMCFSYVDVKPPVSLLQGVKRFSIQTAMLIAALGTRTIRALDLIQSA